MKYLIFLGTGGFARELLWLAREINREAESVGRNEPVYRILGFVGEEENGPKELGGLPVLGNDAWVFEHLERNVHFVAAVGNPALRKKIAGRYLEEGFRPATLIHPSVPMAEDVQLGQGCVICAGAVLTTNIRLGAFTTVNLNATVGHDVVVGGYSTIHPGANISGAVQLGEGVEVGTGAIVLPGLEIGDAAVIGAGAVVTKALEGGKTYVGNPAVAH